MVTDEKYFGRLATNDDLEVIKEHAKKACQLMGCGSIYEQDDDAGTARFTAAGKTLFKAIAKDMNTWIVMYNKDFYTDLGSQRPY